MTSRIEGRAIGVVGMARSGLAAAKLAHRLGGHPFVSDGGPAQKLEPALASLRSADIPYEVDGHTDRVLEADYLVVSPGVPPTAPILALARKRGIPIYAEIELASWVCRARLVAITGSNGKTTTTTLTAEILAESGLEAVACGNIGLPLSDVADRLPPAAVAVVEVSSYQLETIDRFRPHVAVLLNVQPDHLDRHGTFEAYRDAKYRIAENQTPTDVLITNADDPAIAPSEITTNARRLTFSIAPPDAADTYVADGQLWIGRAAPRPVIRCTEVRLPGRHNLANAAAACLLSAQLDVPAAPMADVLRRFRGVEHRLEPVTEINHILFINDSKATNVESACVALEAVDGPTHLILGGRDKGAPYTPIITAGRSTIRQIILIGEAADAIERDLGAAFPLRRAASLGDAVALAFDAARPGDTVLLSPACSSFDMFEDYEHRGQTFKHLVTQLSS